MIALPPIKALRGTIIAAGIATLVLSQRHLGFMVALAAFILLPWIIASIWISIANPQKRSLQAAKVAIWLLSMGVVIGVHYFIASQTRVSAQEVVDAVANYYTSHGTYPEDLQSIGYTKDKIRSMVGMGGYVFERDRQPYFFYASTYVPFEVDRYDFSKHEWTHRD
jgi:hypothetical protein